MRTAGSPDVVLVTDLADQAQRGAARRALRVLAGRRRTVDVVTVGPVTATARDLAGWRRARRVRVRHLVAEAVGAEPGAPLRRLPLDPVAERALTSEPWAAPDVVPALGPVPQPEEHDAAPGTVEAYGASARVLVRERRDGEGRTYQRDFVDADGVTRYVSWVDRETGEVSSMLELDPAARVVRRRATPQWVADRLAVQDDVPSAVVATSASADEVVALLPEAWRTSVTTSGASDDDLDRILERTGAGR